MLYVNDIMTNITHHIFQLIFFIVTYYILYIICIGRVSEQLNKNKNKVKKKDRDEDINCGNKCSKEIVETSLFSMNAFWWGEDGVLKLKKI